MKTNRTQLRDGTIFAATAALVVVGLPLVAVLAFAARAALFATAIAVMLVGIVGFALSPRFRAWVQALDVPTVIYKGLRVPADVMLSDSHAWARFTGRQATVGADGLAQLVLGPIDQVDLPSTGRRVERGEPIARLWHGERALTVKAPVAGEVVSVNGTLLDQPTRMNAEPFANGWLVRLRAATPAADRAALHAGEKARTWFKGEVDRMLGLLSPEPVPVLADGGAISAAVYQHIDDATFTRLEDELFGRVAPDRS